MQKGIATLEIIIGTLIIALLLSAAIPNVTKILDRVSLDYETKRLYSELRFLQAMNRSKSSYKVAVGTGRTFDIDKACTMTINKNKFSYQILRGNIPVRDVHYMQNIKELTFSSNKITSNSNGQATDTSGKVLSNTLTLTSKLGKKSSIVFDSVGRIRGG